MNGGGGKAIYSNIYSHGTTASRGVAVFLGKKLMGKIDNIYRDTEGRTIVFDIQLYDQWITIVAIYAPNEDTPRYFKEIDCLLQKRHENKIIIGDFNLTLNLEMDRKNTFHNNTNAKEVVEDMMDHYYLKDIWRIHYPDQKEYSWFKRGNVFKASRIDFALVSGGLDQKVKHSTYLASLKTDHRALFMTVDMEYSERGRGFWKMNTSLLQEKEYIGTINKELEATLKLTEASNPKSRWEKIKERVKKSTIKYSKNKQNDLNLVISQLSEVVNEYESRFPLQKEEDKLYIETKADLEEKVMEKTRGVMFRSKVQWYEQGEKSSKYFFSLEKARYNAKTCFKLIDEEGKETTETSEILEKQRSFYKELYSKDSDVKFNLVNNTGIEVPKDLRKEQEEPLTIDDLAKATKSMNNNKTPGEDGIPVDFYKVFWQQLKQPLLEVVNEIFDSKKLHDSARRGILNLIPKAQKDTRYVKNLRPITLLNTDYKIVEKAIANRMTPALEHIIHTDQRGFMKNRRISVNIRKMLDIIHLAEKEDLEAVVMSLDFVKCFDKCSFSILHGSLDFFGFGDIIKEWTRILYKDFTVKIQNNGHFSESIDIEKGVHQGGCCSSIYFLVIAEILAISLRENKNIEGITFKDVRNLLNQFADDMDICTLCKEQSIRAILGELENFRKHSGFTVSYEKTTLYRIGSLRFSSAKLYCIDQFRWSNEDINVLGVTITHEDLVDKNYNDIVSKIRKILQSWVNRGLSLIGKVQVVNTLVASLFVYKMMVLPSIPEKVIKNVDNQIRDFLWDHKKSKIAYSVLHKYKRLWWPGFGSPQIPRQGLEGLMALHT